jgi:hypothetical protein
VTVPTLHLTVPGRPALLIDTKANADAWKQQVAEAVGAVWAGPYLAEPCAVRLVFQLPAARVWSVGLVNLLKATIDGMSARLFAPSTLGHVGPWNTEDWWITELHARKEPAEDTPGVEITVGPAGGTFAPAPGPGLVAAFVPGRVPLWAAPEAGAPCYAAYKQAFAGTPLLPPDQDVGAHWRFVIEPGRMRSADLDNFCVPAGIATCYALFGDLKHPQRLIELYATKEAAPTADALGTHVQVWQVGPNP